jgi:hypothetical protein
MSFKIGDDLSIDFGLSLQLDCVKETPRLWLMKRGRDRDRPCLEAFQDFRPHIWRKACESNGTVHRVKEKRFW